jgi:uncharacterized protein YndB with AHSA1/START domain
MPASTRFEAEPSKPTIVMTRVFDAPARLVFEAMTRPEHLTRWWGPRQMQMAACEVDLRVGGHYRFVQRAPDGKDYGFQGVWKEIVPYERLVFTQRMDVPPWSSADQVVTVTLEEYAGKTKVTLREVFNTMEDREGWVGEGAEEGAVESWERLAEVVSQTDRELMATRVFAAPLERVWRAFSEPEHLARWWGPHGFTNTFQEFDFRPGGRWKYVMHGPQGAHYPNESVFVELMRPTRIVLDHAVPKFRLTVTLAEEGGKTRVTMHQLFPSAADRGRVEGIAAKGNVENLERLEAEVGAMAG